MHTPFYLFEGNSSQSPFERMHGSKHRLLEVCAASLGQALSLRDSNVWDQSCCVGPPPLAHRLWWKGRGTWMEVWWGTHWVITSIVQLIIFDLIQEMFAGYLTLSMGIRVLLINTATLMTVTTIIYWGLTVCQALSFYILHLHLRISFSLHNNPMKLYWYSLEEKEAWGDKLVHDHTVRIGLTYWPVFGSGA